MFTEGLQQRRAGGVRFNFFMAGQEKRGRKTDIWRDTLQ